MWNACGLVSEVSLDLVKHDIIKRSETPRTAGVTKGPEVKTDISCHQTEKWAKKQIHKLLNSHYYLYISTGNILGYTVHYTYTSYCTSSLAWFYSTSHFQQLSEVALSELPSAPADQVTLQPHLWSVLELQPQLTSLGEGGASTIHTLIHTNGHISVNSPDPQPGEPGD